MNIESSSSELDKEKIIYVFGHQAPDTDTICSSIVASHLEKELGNPYQVIPCRLGPLNKESKFAIEYFKTDEPTLITNASDADEVILVDHNNFGQSAKDITKAKICKIIDHHGLSGFSCPEPIYILTEPVGCCCTVLYKLFIDKQNHPRLFRNGCCAISHHLLLLAGQHELLHPPKCCSIVVIHLSAMVVY